MWYYYITIVYRVLKINNCSIVWCDVLVWYIDQFRDRFYVTDLYGINIWTYRNTPVQVFYEERRYRYSGTLYTKLNSLINILCFDRYAIYVDITAGLKSDNCYFTTFSYNSHEFIFQHTRSLWIYPTPISDGEYYNKIYYHNNAYFIDN